MTNDGGSVGVDSGSGAAYSSSVGILTLLVKLITVVLLAVG